MNDERKMIFLVDDSDTILTLGRSILSGYYRVVTFNSGLRLLNTLEKFTPSLILLDMEMPQMSGFEVIQALKSNPDTAGIPVIFLTSRNDEESELMGIDLGAHDYITKPISPPRLLKRVELCLQLEAQKQELINHNEKLEDIVAMRTKSLVEMRNVVLETMSHMVERRDHFTGKHIERTKAYIKILFDTMKVKDVYTDELSQIEEPLALFSSQLHDVGKICVSDSILLKPGKLTSDEFEKMKCHAEFGGQIIEHLRNKTSNSGFLDYARTFALYHHEKWNGRGYPFGFKGQDIPLLGRIMAIADVYDALISERSYKKALPHSEAVEIIRGQSGKAFDPLLIDLFHEIHTEFEAAILNLEKNVN